MFCQLWVITGVRTNWAVEVGPRLYQVRQTTNHNTIMKKILLNLEG